MNELDLKTKEWGRDILESIADDWDTRQRNWQRDVDYYNEHGESYSIFTSSHFSKEPPSKRNNKNFIMDSIMDGYIEDLDDIRCISPRLLANKEIAMMLLDIDSRAIMFFSPKLRCDPDITSQVIKGANYLHYDEAIYSVGPKARDDKELMTIWGESFENAVEAASPRLQADREFVRNCIVHSPYALSSADISLRNDIELCLYAVEIHGDDALYHIETEVLKNEEFLNRSYELVPNFSKYEWKELVRKQIAQNESRNIRK